MIFSLDVRKARKGDCLLLHFGSADEPALAIIDGGPSNVYAPHLKPRLTEIRAARHLDEGEPLPVDVVMVSHVDDDHIRGILDLTKELRATAGAPAVRVMSLWHNTFDDIIGNTPTELTAAISAQFGAAALGGELPDDATLDANQGGDEEIAKASLKVLASIEQGHRLRGDAETLGIDLNSEFGGKLIVADSDGLAMGDVTFTVAGPMKPELLQLQKKHDEWLKQQRTNPAPAGRALAAYVDKSVPNLSSIVVLAKCGGKTILLTGDARGDKILEGLETVGVLAPGGPLHVDVLKVPHHGSSNNLDVDFFERLTADHYVLSGDGEHGNPERATFEMLFDARGTDPFDVHLTYEIEEIDALRKADWQKEQAKERARHATHPRPDWSPSTHGLEAFFKAGRLAAGQTLRIVRKSTPHVIDLLDPLGF